MKYLFFQDSLKFKVFRFLCQYLYQCLFLFLFLFLYCTAPVPVAVPVPAAVLMPVLESVLVAVCSRIIINTTVVTNTYSNNLCCTLELASVAVTVVSPQQSHHHTQVRHRLLYNLHNLQAQ